MLKVCIFNLFQGYVSRTFLNWCIIGQSSEHRTHSVCGCFGVASHIVFMEDGLLEVSKGDALKDI